MIEFMSGSYCARISTVTRYQCPDWLNESLLTTVVGGVADPVTFCTHPVNEPDVY